MLAESFFGVGDAFAANFADGLELGASFAVVIDDEVVVDIRGGFVDRAKTEPWNDDTLACLYSSGKAVVSLLIAREVSKGALDYDAPVAEYWPEFGAAGKGEIHAAIGAQREAFLNQRPRNRQVLAP